MQHGDTSGGQTLAALIAATQPVVLMVLETAGSTPAAVTCVDLHAGNPVGIRVTVRDDAGRVRTFDGVPFGEAGSALAQALSALLTDGLNQMPASAREKLARWLDAADSTLTVRIDPALETATASLVVPCHEPIALFTLASGSVH